MQEIIAYIIMVIAVGYTIYSAVKKFSGKDVPKCGSSCEGCSIKDCHRTMLKNSKSLQGRNPNLP